MKLIGKTMESNEELINKLFISIVIYVALKVLNGAVLLYISSTQLMNGIYPSEAQYALINMYNKVSNLVSMIMMPLLLLFATKKLCEVLYRVLKSSN